MPLSHLSLLLLLLDPTPALHPCSLTAALSLQIHPPAKPPTVPPFTQRTIAPYTYQGRAGGRWFAGEAFILARYPG